MTREEMKLFRAYGPPNEWSGAVAGSMGEERRRMLQRAWKSATRGEKARAAQAFVSAMRAGGGTMEESYEMDANERKAMAASRQADKARAAAEAKVANELRALEPDDLAILVDEINEALDAMGLPSLTGPDDAKLARAFLLVASAAAAAGVRVKLPKIDPDDASMFLGAFRAMAQDPKLLAMIEQGREAEGEAAGAVDEEAEAEAMEAEKAGKKKKQMDLFRSRV